MAGQCEPELFVEARQADLETPVELLLFSFDDFGDAVGGVFEVGVGAGHLVAHGEDHLVEKWLLLAKEAAVADAPAEDLAQDVAAAFIRGTTPSLIRNVAARAWSAMMRRLAFWNSQSILASTCFATARLQNALKRIVRDMAELTPISASLGLQCVNSAAFSISGVKRSVSKLDNFP